MRDDERSEPMTEDRLRRSDVVRTDILQRLAAALDIAAPSAGVVPPLWHWTAFLDNVPTSRLGVDGHPRGGGLVESPPYPRRMFAGARLSWTNPMPSDSPLERVAEVGVPVAKDGRAGPMAFVTVRFSYRADGVEVAREEQDLVYLPERTADDAPASRPSAPAPAATGAGAAVPVAESDPADAPLVVRTATFDPPALFRFSALTYNTHRIHYDQPYVTGEEGYPGLVVHGPLLAVMLADLVRDLHGDDALVGFAFKARSPAFAGETLTFEARPAEPDEQAATPGEGDGAVLALTARRGPATLMVATARLRAGLARA
jgi:3-methylfumaryl-CoA hydratase